MFFVRYLGILWVLFMHSGVVAQQWQVGPPGMPLPIIVPGGGQTPCTVDFEDFIAFAQAFNSTQGDPNFNHLADTNQDGVVNFPDFIAFAQMYGLTAVNGGCTPKHTVSGNILVQEKPIENVWIDVLEKQISLYNSPAITKTNAIGYFEFDDLESGDYTIVPKKLGYDFTPDTIRVTIDAASVTVPPVEGELLFGLMSVKVLQDSLPVPDVEVLVTPSDDVENVVGTGITDPSGISVVRVEVREGQTDITGMYDVRVRNPETNVVLDTWQNISIQHEDRRRLFLDVGKDPFYMPEREYPFYLEGQDMTVTPSNEFVTAQFQEGVSDSMKQVLFDDVGLKIEDSYGLIPELLLTKGRDHFAVLDAMHRLRKSGLVQYVNPGFRYGDGTVTPTDEIKVYFQEDVSLVDVGAFATEMGATVVRFADGNAYLLRVNDLLTRDIFEVEAQYHNHPFVERIEIQAYHTIVIVN